MDESRSTADLAAIEAEIIRRGSADNPRSRQHDERTADRRQMWRCVPIGDIIGFRDIALRVAARPADGKEGLRETRLYFGPDDIEAALRRLHGPITHDESVVMAAAQAAADGLRGGRIVRATKPSPKRSQR